MLKPVQVQMNYKAAHSKQGDAGAYLALGICKFHLKTDTQRFMIHQSLCAFAYKPLYLSLAQNNLTPPPSLSITVEGYD